MNLYNKLRLLPDLPRLVVSHLNDIEHRQESRLNRMLELFREKPEAAPVATLLVIGETRVGDGDPFTTTWAASRTVEEGRHTTTLEVEAMRPLESCTAVVLVDLQRVEVSGLFVGVDCIVLGSPLGFFDTLTPGQRVRATIIRREPSGK